MAADPVLLLLAGRNGAEPPADMRTMTEAVAAHYYGSHGPLGYRLFEAINRVLFAAELPWPLVVWGLTAHGRCLGYTSVGAAPIITLHPSLLGGTEKADPWGIPPGWLGVLYVLDVLIHECMHVAVHYLRGGRQGGDSSHNNPAWIAEVNRLAPLLGFAGVEAGMKRPTRMGKTIKRVETGTISYQAVTTFPGGLRTSRATADAYYRARVLPFPVALPLPWQERYQQPSCPSTGTPVLHTTRRNGVLHQGEAAQQA